MMHLGFLTHVTSGRSPADSLAIALDLFQAAEELGFATGWVAQHRFNDPDGSLPAPLTFLAAAAATTTRIGLGTGVIVLPTDDPIAVAEQALVVDGLSNGRLQLGIGSGGHRDTFDAVGADLAGKREAFSRRLDILDSALRGEPINGSAAHLHTSAGPILDRVWQSTTGEAGARRAGRRGDGLLLARNAYFTDIATDDQQVPLIDAYRDALPEGVPARIGVSRTVFPTDGRATDSADSRAGLDGYIARMIAEGHFPAGRSDAYYRQRAHMHHGSAEDVAASLLADRALTEATELICQTAPLTVDPELTIAALEATATAVASHLGDLLVRPVPAQEVGVH